MKFVIQRNVEPALFVVMEKGDRAGPHKYLYKKTVGGKTYYVYKQETRRNWVLHKPGLPKTTAKEHKNPDGSYKAERRPLHDKIMNKFFEKAKRPAENQQKVAIVLMGGPASGKTSMVKQLVGDKFDDFVNVNPDDVKEEMPEYNDALDFMLDGKRTSARDAAFMCHEESSELASEIYKRGVAGGFNLIVDGTGRKAKRHMKRIKELRDAGYHVQVLMPDVDVDVAVKRVGDRAEETGRFVPMGPPPQNTPDVVRDTYNEVPKNFETIARMADEFVLFELNKFPPTKKWSGKQGQPDVVYDPAFIKKFSAKAGVEIRKSGGMEKSEYKTPYVTMDEMFENAKKPMKKEKPKKKKFDRHTGVIQIVGDIDLTGHKGLRYK